MKFLRKALIIVPALILFITLPAHSHGGGDEHSAPKPVQPVMEEPSHGAEEFAHGAEESAHGGEDHHAPATLEPAMEGENDHHGAEQRLKKYVVEELHQAALNKAKAEAAELKAMEETDKLKYRTVFAVFGVFILLIGLVLRYAPGRAQR